MATAKSDANYLAFSKRKKEINAKGISIFGSRDKFEKWLSKEKKKIDSVKQIDAVDKLLSKM